MIMVAANFTPVPRIGYRLGAPRGGFWAEVLNSDAKVYGGSGHGNFGGVKADPIPSHGKAFSLPLVLPPLGVVFLKSEWKEEFQPISGFPQKLSLAPDITSELVAQPEANDKSKGKR
jgi:hypothetical protein